MRRVMFLAVWLVGATALVAQQPPVAESPAAAAAKKRQEALRSWEIRYCTTHTFHEPTEHKPYRAPVIPPPRETETRLLVVGDDVRVEFDQPRAPVVGPPDPPARSPTDQLAVLRGDTEKRYGASKGGAVQGHIAPRTANWIGGQWELRWLLMHVRGFALSPAGDAFVGAWRPTGAAEDVNGARLVPYRLESPFLAEHGHFVRGWADPESDHAFVRLRVASDNGNSELLTTAFAVDAATGLTLPTAWTSTITRADGRVMVVRESCVTSARVNPAPPASEFDLAFPPGATVFDARDGRMYRARDDGSLQWIGPGPGTAPDRLPEPRTAPTGWPIIAGIAAGLVGLLWYARSRAKSPLK